MRYTTALQQWTIIISINKITLIGVMANKMKNISQSWSGWCQTYRQVWKN